MTPTETIQSFQSLKALIIGDVMIDEYIRGEVERISPEAPVPIVHVREEEQRLGGAANVAKNIAAMGATPFLATVIGEDAAGERFLHLMEINHLPTKGIITSKNRITTQKTRILAKNHQIIRFDKEVSSPVNEADTQLLLNNIRLILKEENIDVVIFQDYDKGVISASLIEKTVHLCKEKTIPVVADPKKQQFKDYKNIDLFKPNIREVKESLQMDIDTADAASLQKAATKMQEILHCKAIFITLGSKGIFVHNKEKSHTLPAHEVRHIADVSGAGDTVISIAALGLAAGLDIDTTAKIANIAGGLVCEEPGVVPVDKEKLLREAAS